MPDGRDGIAPRLHRVRALIEIVIEIRQEVGIFVVYETALDQGGASAEDAAGAR